ncbi:MAG: N-acetyltransferase family protein [Clostridium sp.]|uniref:GNAT family N-acetyltransferase n=1 Tax=Clostridium sp. TaxID=1506 RepID=UPI002FC682CC
MEITIEYLTKDHWLEVSNIYKEGIDTEFATFQRDIPSYSEWDNNHHQKCRLVACNGDRVLGFICLSPVSKRESYLGAAELSLYVGKKYRGIGVGQLLLNSLVKESEKHGFWTLQAVIVRENIPSLNLHKKCGFREIGYREKIAKMKTGIWHDVILMEKRSSVVN